MIQVDDRVRYKNVLGDWEEGVVIKINKTTYRIVNNKNFKVLSIRKENVEKIEEE
ncbi:hypothetical protein [Anoxybacter fermentans]|uniref:hypothetical protein n=1 Tax=Anoxybacter fermentans TaxID=1323375 RepID=UPI0013DFA09B|nr:hypothetical protein [Anoxybacter fermentans]